MNNFAKLAKWFGYIVSAYMYGAFDYVFLLCPTHVFKVNHLFQARNSLTFRQLQNVDSL